MQNLSICKYTDASKAITIRIWNNNRIFPNAAHDGFRTELYQTQLWRKLRHLELDEPASEPGPGIAGYGTLLVTSPTQVVLLQQLQVLNVTVQKAGLKLSPWTSGFSYLLESTKESVAWDVKSLLKIFQ
jgi:hypothetical protein